MVTRSPGHILIVDDSLDIQTAGRLLLKQHFASVSTISDPEDIPGLIAENPVDVILLDMNYAIGEQSGREGFLWLNKILEIDPDAVVILITAYGSVDAAVNAMKQGATDFIIKPWQNEKLVATVHSALRLRESRRETQQLKSQNRELTSQLTKPQQKILGQSRAVREVLSIVNRAAPTEANVLILGENGTGKELIARELHAQSHRKDEIFMAVDLGAVSESLFESELFGHKKGAFTDARQDRIGRFQAAHGGTLFLDEIGNIPLHMQAKLLTALEQREVTPVGANAPVAIDVRVISATNLAAAKLRDEAIFRQDLLYRLNTVEIPLPPLRERAEDIPLLVRAFISVYCKKYNRAEKEISPATLSEITAYAWPGNIRALRHAVERAVILSDEDQIMAKDFNLSEPAAMPALTASEPVLDTLNLDSLEKRAVESALRRHQGNVSRAAHQLGITRAALYRRMEKHGL